MIEVRAELGDGSTSITVTGHEDAGDGPAVLCAAVTAITHTALLGLEQLALQHPDHVSVNIKEING